MSGLPGESIPSTTLAIASLTDLTIYPSVLPLAPRPSRALPALATGLNQSLLPDALQPNQSANVSADEGVIINCYQGGLTVRGESCRQAWDDIPTFPDF